MLFNSLPFLFLFLPITLLGFHLLGRYGRRPVIAWLGVASVVFYARWNVHFVFFLLGSILVNYCMALLINRAPDDSRARKRLLFAGVAVNLLALFYFKYLFKTLLLLLHLGLAGLEPHAVLLPLGISFFTFTQISYLVDLAQGQAERQDFLSYLLFVTFFPHLIAGPILHHKEMMPQFGRVRPEDEAKNLDQALTPVPPSHRFALKASDVSLGMTWFLMGLAKKVLIADQLSGIADTAFNSAGTLTAFSAYTGVIVYSMQLYFDFSGYSDMALGLARMFSIRFPLNFDSPYKATSVTEYWQRWHMTLTRYITLYLYNPLLLAVQRRRMAGGKKDLAQGAGDARRVHQHGRVPHGGDDAADRAMARRGRAVPGVWRDPRRLPDGQPGLAALPPAHPQRARARAAHGHHAPGADGGSLPSGVVRAHLFPVYFDALRTGAAARHDGRAWAGIVRQRAGGVSGVCAFSHRLVHAEHAANPRSGAGDRVSTARTGGPDDDRTRAGPNVVSAAALAPQCGLGIVYGGAVFRDSGEAE